jgi:hypothetical protein
MKPTPTPQPLSHLTALHMLGRLFERIDQHQDTPQGPSCNRYQCAMRCLCRSLDQIEHQLMVREVLSQHAAYRD